jgi:hypothetical protein
MLHEKDFRSNPQNTQLTLLELGDRVAQNES